VSDEFCVVEVVERATSETYYAACPEDRRSRQNLANEQHASVRIVLPHLSRSTAERVARRLSRVRSAEERRARCG
jgi:hypothetical protein